MDVHDIDGIYPLYQYVVQQLTQTASAADASGDPITQMDRLETGVRGRSTDVQLCGVYVLSLLTKSWPEQMQIIRDYLLATTAKDCSLMITMQVEPAGTLPHCSDTEIDSCDQPNIAHPGMGKVSLPDLALEATYKVAVVDLDLKPHAKINSHYRLDQQIMQHTPQQVNDQNM